jgi:hypothetical protein
VGEKRQNYYSCYEIHDASGLSHPSLCTLIDMIVRIVIVEKDSAGGH